MCGLSMRAITRSRNDNVRSAIVMHMAHPSRVVCGRVGGMGIEKSECPVGSEDCGEVGVPPLALPRLARSRFGRNDKLSRVRVPPLALPRVARSRFGRNDKLSRVGVPPLALPRLARSRFGGNDKLSRVRFSPLALPRVARSRFGRNDKQEKRGRGCPR